MKKRFEDRIGPIVDKLLKEDLFSKIRSDDELLALEKKYCASHKEPYTHLINSLLGIGKHDVEDFSKSLWVSITTHRKKINKKLGRTIPLRAAAIDWLYLHDEDKRPLKTLLLSKHLLEATINQSRYDDLTKLYSRSEFLTQLEKLINLDLFIPSTLAFIDLDGFKNVNDSLGHGKGDEILKGFTDLATKTLRSTDVLGRLGGDEFAFLLVETDLVRSREILKRLRKIFEDHYSDYKVSFSFGLTSLRQNEQAVKALKRADKGMYKNKRMRKSKTS